MKLIRAACLLSLIAMTLLAVGCKNGEVNTDANAEKNKEQGQFDKRGDAVSKMADQAGSK